MRARAARILFTLVGLTLLPHLAAHAEDAPDAVLRVDLCPSIEESTDLSPTQVDAMLTERAGDSYDRGLVLYDEGDYHAAVDAFVDSYCSKAHPSAFYNIAQSYERLLNFELSIRYFERYVAEAGPDAANSKKAALRADVLSKLPAQVRVATAPEGAAITIRSESGVTARGSANSKEPIEVTQGRYTMHIELPGYESVERELIARPGSPYSDYVRLEATRTELEVTASPASGRIFIGDRLVGVGRYSESLPVGTYEITVEAKGRETTKQVVQLRPDRRLSTSIALPRKQSNGRRTLLAGSTLGLGLTGGVAISRVFGRDNAITAAGTLATMGLGFGGAYYGIPESTTLGDAWFILGASIVGFFEGTVVGAYFGCKRSEVDGVQDEICNTSTVTGAALTGSITGVIAAALSYQKLRLTTGDAAVLGSGAFWGIGSGALLFAVFDSDVRVRDPMLFAGLNLGLIAASGLMANTRVSLRRIAIIDLAGVGGVLAGVSIAQAFDSDDERLRHFTLLGGIAGLVTSTFLTRYMDEEESSKRSKSKLLPSVSSSKDMGGQSLLSIGIASDF